MAASFFKDEYNVAMASPAGLRPLGLTTGIISVTLSGSTQELTLPAKLANAQGDCIVRVCAGAQGAYYGFGAAGAGASFTGITNMIQLPANAVEYVKVRGTDASVYALQLGTAGTFQVAVLG